MVAIVIVLIAIARPSMQWMVIAGSPTRLWRVRETQSVKSLHALVGQPPRAFSASARHVTQNRRKADAAKTVPLVVLVVGLK
jgi:hypothetical protein